MQFPAIQSHVFRDSMPDVFPSETVVLIDAHNFTTTAIEALENGADEVVPLTSIDGGVPGRVSIIAGDEDEGVANHPREMTKEFVRGEVIGIDSWNGTSAVHAIRATDGWEQVYLGSTINAPALAEELRPYDSVDFVLAGSGGEIPPEDILAVQCICQYIATGDSGNVKAAYEEFYELLIPTVYDAVYTDETELGPFGRPINHARNIASEVGRVEIVPTMNSSGGFE